VYWQHKGLLDVNLRLRLATPSLAKDTEFVF
jgi:hypothetical protein